MDVFYQNSVYLNNYGLEKPEWLLLIDGLIVLPLLCFWCFKDRKEAALKAIVYSCLVILLGSMIIPESSKLVWHYFESGRYFALALLILLELTTILSVIFSIKTLLYKPVDPDLAISKPIEKYFGKSIISQFLSFEARLWTYVLFSKRINTNSFIGDQHFSCHQKDATQSNLFGFILIILFELPIAHLLLHFLWSPWGANVISLLTILSLLFFIAEYNAISKRPVSVTTQRIIIRYGIWNPLVLDLSKVVSVQLNSHSIKRASHIKRFNLSGHPNIEIKLHSGELIYLGLDSPKEFISAVNNLKAELGQ